MLKVTPYDAVRPSEPGLRVELDQCPPCRRPHFARYLGQSISIYLQAALDKKDAALDALRVSHAAVEGQLREAEALKAADARARRSAEKKVRSCYGVDSHESARINCGVAYGQHCVWLGELTRPPSKA